MSILPLSLPSLLTFLLTISTLPHPSTPSTTSFVYGGCSQQKYTRSTPYESNVNSVLTSLVNSAASANFNEFKISVPGSTQSDIVYGLYQCRSDLQPDCHSCVAQAVGQLGTICADSAGAGLQLEGCFVKYDNNNFLGVEDKTLVYKRCGPSIGYESDGLTRRDAVMDYLAAAAGQYFRVGGSGKVQGMIQCVQDLSTSACQDCVSDVIRRLKSECGTAPWGDVYLAKCYARYSESGMYSTGGEGFGCGRQQRWWLVVAGGFVMLW